MIQFFGLLPGNWHGFNQFRRSLLSGFRTFLPPESEGDTFTRSGS